MIAVYADWEFAKIKGCGWGWAGVIWVYTIITYFPQDILKFAIRYALTGNAWKSMIDKKVNNITCKNYKASSQLVIFIFSLTSYMVVPVFI